ncbi:protein TolB [Streptomyces sp. TUS-ST3]|uniref:TolB family protein n=1 Tax=Streptomyces sp. TUS-ST3 TaxID=3025591 RepID=UPI0024E0B3F0|nr:protein TolB [Streptomyces sp. TUS-ST3]
MSGRAVATSCPVTSVSGIPLRTALLLAFTGTTTAAAQHAPRTEPVSTAADGTQGDGASSTAITAPNGRYTALRSPATNLAPQGPAHPGICSSIRDLTTGEVTKIEQPLRTPRFSADGRWATYTDWPSRTMNAFLSDLSTGTRIQVGAPDSRDASAEPDISADGRYVAHRWIGHPQFPTRIDLYERLTGTHETVSTGPQDSTLDMNKPSISGNGRRVAYQDSGTGDVWIVDPCRHQRRAGRRPRHRRADRGRRRHPCHCGPAERQRPRPGDGFDRRLLCTGPDQHSPDIRVAAVSPDGRRLLTRDADVNLPLHGRYGGREVPVGHGSATAGSLSAHGRSVVYSTVDAHVVPGDTNGMYDVIQRRSS